MSAAEGKVQDIKDRPNLQLAPAHLRFQLPPPVHEMMSDRIDESEDLIALHSTFVNDPNNVPQILQDNHQNSFGKSDKRDVNYDQPTNIEDIVDDDTNVSPIRINLERNDDIIDNVILDNQQEEDVNWENVEESRNESMKPAISMDCTHPDFLQNYYKNSRLHHLSTWRSHFIEQLLLELCSQPTALMQTDHPIHNERVIMHVDMDCFFASVAVRSNPGLVNKPVVVCHSDTAGGSADIASANYVARSFGIRNGMWIGRAKELCPHLRVVGYQFPLYEAISRSLFQILLSFSPVR